MWSNNSAFIWGGISIAGLSNYWSSVPSETLYLDSSSIWKCIGLKIRASDALFCEDFFCGIPDRNLARGLIFEGEENGSCSFTLSIRSEFDGLVCYSLLEHPCCREPDGLISSVSSWITFKILQDKPLRLMSLILKSLLARPSLDSEADGTNWILLLLSVWLISRNPWRVPDWNDRFDGLWL